MTPVVALYTGRTASPPTCLGVISKAVSIDAQLMNTLASANVFPGQILERIEAMIRMGES